MVGRGRRGLIKGVRGGTRGRGRGFAGPGDTGNCFSPHKCQAASNWQAQRPDAGWWALGNREGSPRAPVPRVGQPDPDWIDSGGNCALSTQQEAWESASTARLSSPSLITREPFPEST